MKTLFTMLRVGLPLTVLGAALWLTAAEPEVTGLIRQTNGEVLLTSSATAGAFYRIDATADMQQWTPLVTVQSAGTDQLLDVATPPLDRRFYRATPLTGTGIITGDHIQTDNGDAILHPIGHASVMVSWNGKAFYSDPSDDTSNSNNGPRFASLPLADVIVVTHAHGDHFSSSRLTALLKPGTETTIFAPSAVRSGMSATLQARTTALANGATTTAHGMTIRAVAMYNLAPHQILHAPGVGNGYVVTMGGKNLYFSGDTDDTPEMRALTNIDAAFVCMSRPSNMEVERAASAVRAFRPRMVFPYHYRQSVSGQLVTYDTALFKQLVGTDLGIEVRQRKFYP